MDNTTIAIKRDVKEKIMEFGNKGESYSEIIERLIESARERQIHDLLMSSEDIVSLKEARKELDKKWPRSK